jgi:hypothetical protein
MKFFFLNDALYFFAHEGPRLKVGKLQILAEYLAEVSIVEASEVITRLDIWNWIVAA